jgi:flagellar secretion chaperone FliS
MNFHFTQSDIAGLYSQNNVQGASPLGLVVALYDTILRDLRRASDAIARGDIEKRTFELNHALRVIAELENVLDFERGGDPAKRLKSFYVTTRGMILNASVKNSREDLSQLWEIFATVRKAWSQAEQKMKKAGEAASQAFPGAEAAISVPPQIAAVPAAKPATAAAAVNSEPHEHAEILSRGNWSA